MDQIIDTATDGRHLSRDRGFLKVSENGAEIGRTPLDQIVGVIVHAHGTTWSTSLLVELAERGAPVVLCGSNHAPRSVLMPLEGHYAQGGRIRAQWQARQPLLKQAWKQVVVAKVSMQSAALAKQALARLIAVDLPLGQGLTPVSVALIKLATSLGQSFETGKPALALPSPPDALILTDAWPMSRKYEIVSGYRIMWVLVMFDLPTDTKPQRKTATDFRNFLLDEDFERSQVSVYARFVNGKEAFQTRVNRIERHQSEMGDIQILNFTDRQYRDIVHFSDQGRQKAREIRSNW